MAEKNLKQKTKQGIMWTFLEMFAKYGLHFLVGIIMARLLSPSDYGITALPAVFLSVARVFMNSGFSSAMIRKPELTEKDLSTAFFYSLVIGILCYVLLYIGAPYIADFYETPVLVPLIRVTALTFLWSPLVTPQDIILSRKLDFKTKAQISVVTLIIGSIVGIILAYMGYGLWSLVAMNVVASFFHLLQLWIKVKWIPREGWSKESFRYLWDYGNKMLGSALLNKLYTNIVPIFVGKYYSPADLGIYNRAHGYAQLPSQNITGVIQKVTFPVLSKLQGDKEALGRNYRRMIRTTAFIVFPLMMMLSALARPLIIVMVTDKWEGSIILLQLMCFSMMWYPVHAMNLNLLQVSGRSDLFFRLEIIKKSYGLLMLFITLPIGLIAVVLGRWVTNVLTLFVNTYYTGKLIGVSFFKQMGDLLPIMGVSFAMWCLIHLSIYYISDYVVQILVGGVVGAVFYLGTSYLLKRPEIDDVIFMLKRRK